MIGNALAVNIYETLLVLLKSHFQNGRENKEMVIEPEALFSQN